MFLDRQINIACLSQLRTWEKLVTIRSYLINISLSQNYLENCYGLEVVRRNIESYVTS